MSGLTWTKFFWSDWDSDPALKLCSFAAQGFWMRMLCIAASHDPIGYVSIAGRPLGVTDLARLTGASETEAETLVGELERNGVFSRDRLGRIFSRRMVADAKRSADAKKWGAQGGNPNLRNNEEKPPRVNPPNKRRHKPQKPEASSKVGGPKEPPTLTGASADALAAESGAPVLRLVRNDPEPPDEIAFEDDFQRIDRDEAKAAFAELAAQLGSRKAP